MKQHQLIQVTTANSISAELKKKVAAAIEKKFGSVTIEYSVDANIISGIKLTVNSVEYDGSVQGKLTEIKQQLLATTMQA